jgi:LPS-assembly lipoprotein
MSLCSAGFRTAGLALALSVSGLAGCTLLPVYSQPDAVHSQLALSYAKPNTRLEQIVYQDLGLRFAQGDGSRIATVSVGLAERDTGLSRVSRLSTSREMQASATLRVEENGKVIFEASRFAIASYTTNGQVLADNAAQVNAGEQATHAVAEQLRLALLASLGQ